MLKAIFEFFQDIGHDLAEAIRWFFSPHAWRIILVVFANLCLLALLGYVAIENYGYSTEVFARCPSGKNLVFIGEFFSFAFFALFSLAAVGEVLNWVDAKRRGEPTGTLSAMFAYGTLGAACGTLALVLLVRCS